MLPQTGWSSVRARVCHEPRYLSLKKSGAAEQEAKSTGIKLRATNLIEGKRSVREVYLHAAKTLRVDLAELALVAAHDWDIHGANKAGLITGFIARKGQFFSFAMEKPDVSGGSLKEVVQKLLALPER